MAAWRVLLGVWAPRMGGGGENKENRVRRMLRIRARAARALTVYLLHVESSGGSGASFVRTLRAAGARILTTASGTATGSSDDGSGAVGDKSD